MRILAVGDIVGNPGRRALKNLLPEIVADEKPDFIIVNGENAAGGMGITAEIGREILQCGADVITSGNHIWKHKEIKGYLMGEPRCLRPANYPDQSPGKGFYLATARNGKKVGVINLQGRVFLPAIDCPFKKAQEIVKELRQETDIIVVDMHAEATSEKMALAWYLSGQVSFVFGTHTHVPTADECILQGGTAFITDIGMTGPHASILGVERQIIVEKFINQLPNKFEVASGDIRLNGALVEIDPQTGTASSIKRICRRLP